MRSSGCNPEGYCSPASLADVDLSLERATNAPHDGLLTVFDRVLAGLVAHRHVLEAIALYLAFPHKDVLSHVVRLGLPTPSTRPMRKPCGQRPWTVDEIRLLIDRWTANLATPSIARQVGRSPGAIWAKARRLGLFRRDRKLLVKADILPSQDLATLAAMATPDAPSPDDTAPALTIGTRAALAQSRTKRIRWTDDIDAKIAKRWFAHQHHKGIARDLGLTEGQVRTRATRMGLPARRDRKLIVQDYAEGQAYDTTLEQSVVKRRCREGNMTFYGPRNGPHTSPKVRQTKRYQELRRSITDAMLYL